MKNIIVISLLIVFSIKITFCQQKYDNLNSINTFSKARLYADHMTNGGSQLSFGFRIGGLLELGTRGNSGYRIYISGAIAKNFIEHSSLATILNYQIDLALFSNGIGSSILSSERNKLNIELRNNVGIVIGGNDQNTKVWGRPLNPNIGDNTSVLKDPLDFSFQLGTTFITGVNHDRNQQIGFGKLGVKWFHLYYMNDGPPYGAIGLGDTGDKYWTGIGGIGYHRITRHGEVTSAELRYSRYTGDEPYLYDLSSELRMNYLPHKDKSVQFLNKGRYQYRMNFKNSASIGINIYQPKITDVQRIIHHGIWAFHPNPTERYFTFFGQYNHTKTYLE